MLISVPNTSAAMPESPDFLQGQKYLFMLPTIKEAAALAISDRYNISLPVGRILSARGFVDDDRLRAFLFSSYEQDVPHSSLLKDAYVAIERIEQAIADGEKILIFGDYDVDGITSSSLAMACLLPLGANINFFLPNRARDGYGLSSKVVRRARDNGYSLIITVDNGISAHDAARVAYELGIDLIITDHHRPRGELPKAVAIVDPQRPDCSYPEKGLPGVGVMFKLMSWLYEQRNLVLPEKAYELLMLGTIADVVPLVGENRFWVRHGLAKVNKYKSAALMQLLANNNVAKARLSSLDIGFMVAPQLNALGRIDDPRDAVKFLISAAREDVQRVGKVLLEMNEARKEIERTIYDEIEKTILTKQIDLDREKIIIARGATWPPGVIGLVAGKLMHNFGRPTIIFHDIGNGTLKGSARSIREFNIFDALTAHEDLLINFGGHSFAAGLAITTTNLPILKERLEERISRDLTPFQLLQKLVIDAQIDLSEVTSKLLHDLEHLEPFGHQNPQPLFLIRSVYVLNKPTLLKEKHVKCTIFAHGMIKPIIFFNRPELYELLQGLQDRPFHVAAHVVTNEWNGRVNVELQGIDIACE